MVFAAVPAGAQTLGDFLDSASRRNVDRQLAAEETARAEAEWSQAWSGLLPSLSANGGWTHNQYEAIVTLPTGPTTSQTVTIIPKDQLDAQLKVEVPLIDPARWLQASAARASSRAVAARELATRDAVARQVVVAYYRLVSARAVQESARRSLALAQAQVELIQSRQKAGVASELDVARAVAEVARNEQLVADAEVLADTSARALETLSGRTPGEVPPLAVDDLRPAPPVRELEQGLAGLPQLEAAHGEQLAAERTQTAAALTLVPTVNAQFTQRFTNATGFQGQPALYNTGVTFNWRLDAPAAFALKARSTAAHTAALQVEKARQQAADQLYSDWLGVRAAVKKVAAAQAQVTAARQATGLAHDRSGAGVATQLDVIQAERDLFSAEVNDIQARTELASARAALRLSAGQPLEATR
ncbi:MAG: TolC family protein [Archangiaceae bacterium]|nr:TolC family protein [Archangiaceae bacterium]